MKSLLKNGYKAKVRPSGHDISENFSTNNGAAIPPNLITVANTESNSEYSRHCKEVGLPIHPARFPHYLPEYFIRMLTDPGDLVVDPFAGSCISGEVAERLDRRWICGELVEDYLEGARVRFPKKPRPKAANGKAIHYKAFHPGILWDSGEEDFPLPLDGGRERAPKK